jgi:hypothetical protein
MKDPSGIEEISMSAAFEVGDCDLGVVALGFIGHSIWYGATEYGGVK